MFCTRLLAVIPRSSHVRVDRLWLELFCCVPVDPVDFDPVQHKVQAGTGVEPPAGAYYFDRTVHWDNWSLDAVGAQSALLFSLGDECRTVAHFSVVFQSDVQN